MIVYNGCGSYTVYVGDKTIELTESELKEIQNLEIPTTNSSTDFKIS